MTREFDVRRNHDNLDSVDDVLLKALSAFDAEFPSEIACMQELLRIDGGDDSLTCRGCDSPDLEFDDQGRVITCRNCRKIRRTTAGTFFHGIRSARPWLFTIWLIEHSIPINAFRLCRLVDISYSSAWHLVKKISLVVLEHVSSDAFPVSTALFSDVVWRRSRETPARSHPIAEQHAIERSLAKQSSSGREDFPDLSEGLARHLGNAPAESGKESRSESGGECGTKNASGGESDTGSRNASDAESRKASGTECKSEVDGILTGLGPDAVTVYSQTSPKPVFIDELLSRVDLEVGVLSANLLLLELDGFVERLPGDYYRRRDRAPNSAQHRQNQANNISPPAAIAVSAILGFVRATFQGISRKYVQTYAALHWCCTDRASWPIGSLLRACRDADAITDEEVVRYVSPPEVLVYLSL